MATSRSVDVAVIGAGTAGLAAYRAAVAEGASTVIVESGPYGTTCARVGCMPSKLLIAAADAAHHARHAAPLGVSCEVRVDGRAVMARVRSERDRFVGFVVRGVEALPATDRLQGHARFVRPGTLDIDGTQVQAHAVVVATGSAPVIPAAFASVKEHVVVNDDVFAWETLPPSVAVFGAGSIGLELGQALHRLGVRVRVFGKSGVLRPLTDPTIEAAAVRAFSDEVPFHADPRVVALRPRDGEAEITYEDSRGKHVESFAQVLVAAGRRPRLSDLELSNAGLELDAQGLPSFDRNTLQCGASPVFLAGDVNDDVPVLHEAVDEGQIAGRNAARYPRVAPGQRRSRLGIVFCDPQIAVVGASFAELAVRDDVVTGEVSFDDQGRSRIMLQNRGLGHLYAQRGTRRLLGAELLGPRAEHLGHLLAWAHQAGMTIDQMLAMPFYHPVIEEGLRTALRDVAARL